MGVLTPATVTYLEMTEDPHLHVGLRSNVGKVALMKADGMDVAYYRFLFHQVGHRYKWFSRTLLTDEALAALLADPGNEIFVLYREGVPAGFFELDYRTSGEVELLFVGLMEDHFGLGLGIYLLASAIERAFEGQPGRVPVQRVHLQTCTLDHPGALALYQKVGFRPFRQETLELDVPDSFFAG